MGRSAQGRSGVARHDSGPRPITGGEERFKATVVATILDSRTEEGLEMLCSRYRVSVPGLRVGVLQGRTKGVAAVYSLERKEILAASREFLYDPFVIIHEFYHHLRSVSGKHRGTEKQADRFAADFVNAYRAAARNLLSRPGEPRD